MYLEFVLDNCDIALWPPPTDGLLPTEGLLPTDGLPLIEARFPDKERRFVDCAPDFLKEFLPLLLDEDSTLSSFLTRKGARDFLSAEADLRIFWSTSKLLK